MFADVSSVRAISRNFSFWLGLFAAVFSIGYHVVLSGDTPRGNGALV